MDPKLLLIARNFDLRRFDRFCNIPNCPREPSKKVHIMECSLINSERQKLATLYLCSSHFSEMMKPFLQELSHSKRPGTTLKSETEEIGCITY